MPKFVEQKKVQPAAGQAPVSESPAPAVETLPLITFDRWFSAKGFKPHWKAGMIAFADTAGRKTAAEWDAIFKSY